MTKLIENTIKNALAKLPEGDEFCVVWTPDYLKKEQQIEEKISRADFPQWVRGKAEKHGKWFELVEVKPASIHQQTEYVVYVHQQDGKRQGCLWVTTLLCEKSSLVKPSQTAILEKLLLPSNDTPRILLQQKIFVAKEPETITEYSGSISELASLIQKAKQKRFWRLG